MTSIAPSPYLRLTSFSGQSPYRDASLGVSMDNEFNAVQVAVNAIENRLSLIQRADGNLTNGSVGPDQLGGGLTTQSFPLTLIATLGVGTLNVAPNVLTVAGPSARFSNLPAGTDFKLFLSKAGTANIASLILQNNLSGRAEIGLSGNDNLHIKMSSDGISFADAIVVSTTTITLSLTASLVGLTIVPTSGNSFTSPGFILDNVGNLAALGGTLGAAITNTISFFGAARIAQRAAGNNAVVPAGGAGAAAGAWDTAGHRDTAIATINEIRTTLVNLGLMPST